jgi:GNAT superfamily N-acetyltransferase
VAGSRESRQLRAFLLGDAMSYELRQVATDEDWDAYHEIRRRVLWDARGHAGSYDRTHPDEHKPGNFPLLLFHLGEPVGVVRVDIEAPVAWFRRVAVRESDQRHGHGRAMLTLAADFARERGCWHLRSNVDAAAVGFYTKLGFVASSGEGASAAVPMHRRI